MRMRRLSVLLVAVLALALGGCLKRGPQSVQQQYHNVPAAQAAQPISTKDMQMTTMTATAPRSSFRDRIAWPP